MPKNKFFFRVIHDEYRDKRTKKFEGIRNLISIPRSDSYQLFWSDVNGLSMETFRKDIGYSVTVIEYGLDIRDIAPFYTESQPYPLPLNPVSKIQAVLDSEK